MKEEIERLKEKNLYRELREIETPQGKRVIVGGRELLNFSSNDYLGLAKEFDCECLKRWGAGSGASRLVCGSFTVHRELERRLAELKKTEDSLLFSTGYMANLGVISTLAGKGDLILSDELNHASIIDGIRLSRVEKVVYPHRSWEFVEEYLRKNREKYRRCFIITDSVFSMDGDIAPLDRLFEIKEKYDAILVIDDAHATGVVGWSSLELFKIEPDEKTVIVGTLGKALGTFGAFVCGSRALREYLINRCRSFIFTTALPPFIACQTLKNIEKVPERMEKLRRLIELFRDLTGIESRSAVFPYIVGSEREAVELSNYLFEKGFFVPAIRPPTVKESRLRITITAEHSEEELKGLWKTIKNFKKRAGEPPRGGCQS
ncbi:aminotransferase class I/II-fold pyridoxal phosphate-dependent enzyme [Thermovibrio sp.]